MAIFSAVNGKVSPLCSVGLATARYSIPHAGSSGRVYALHNDKRALLQGGHGEVAVVGDGLQVTAIARPYWVAHLEDAPLKGANLGQRCRED